jgi:hypothetical protein
MRELKFRQWNGDRWHYWGFINDSFVGPISLNTVSEQFTGLLDRTGEEIYENDIVMRWRMGRSEWRNKEGAWIKHGPARLIQWNEKTHQVGWNIGKGTTVKYEVIGNLRENSELLK